MVRIRRSHRRGRGSIPRQGVCIFCKVVSTVFHVTSQLMNGSNPQHEFTLILKTQAHVIQFQFDTPDAKHDWSQVCVMVECYFNPCALVFILYPECWIIFTSHVCHQDVTSTNTVNCMTFRAFFLQGDITGNHRAHPLQPEG